MVPGTHIGHEEVAAAGLELPKDGDWVPLGEGVADEELLEARVVDHEAGLRRVVGLLYKKALGEELGNLSNLY